MATLASPLLSGTYTTSGVTLWQMGADEIPMSCSVPAPPPGSSGPAPFTQAAPTPPGRTPPPPPPPSVPPPPPPAAAPAASTRIPPTGITTSQCYESGTSTFALCSSPATTALNAQQDGHRAASRQLSYSLVASFPVTSCVKDDSTGLIWEGKEATGQRAGGNSFSTNYDSLTAIQVEDFPRPSRAPTQAELDASTNTLGYVKYVNGIALCGYTGWRVPTLDELIGIMDFSVTSSARLIDATWFPNSGNQLWASTPYPGQDFYAFSMSFAGAASQIRYRSWSNSGIGLRLVRGTQ